MVVIEGVVIAIATAQLSLVIIREVVAPGIQEASALAVIAEWYVCGGCIHSQRHCLVDSCTVAVIVQCGEIVSSYCLVAGGMR